MTYKIRNGRLNGSLIHKERPVIGMSYGTLNMMNRHETGLAERLAASDGGTLLAFGPPGIASKRRDERCACGARLARDHNDLICSPCQRKAGDA